MIFSKFDQFLKEVLKLPTAVFEGPSFGYTEHSVRTCFPQQVRPSSPTSQASFHLFIDSKICIQPSLLEEKELQDGEGADEPDRKKKHSPESLMWGPRRTLFWETRRHLNFRQKCLETVCIMLLAIDCFPSWVAACNGFYAQLCNSAGPLLSGHWRPGAQASMGTRWRWVWSPLGVSESEFLRSS